MLEGQKMSRRETTTDGRAFAMDGYTKRADGYSRPTVEVPMVKGGQNTAPSQVLARPPRPAPISRATGATPATPPVNGGTNSRPSR